MLWHIDAGHGWLEVNRSDIIKYNLSVKISKFSYQKGKKVYLEEDCDAGKFLAEYFCDKEWYLKSQYLEQCQDIKRKIYKCYAPIRNYNPYTLES